VKLNWIERISKDSYVSDSYKNPTLSLYTSMVYGFANHFPYSMDIEQPEYVPADFFNMIPNDVMPKPKDYFRFSRQMHRQFIRELLTTSEEEALSLFKSRSSIVVLEKDEYILKRKNEKEN